MLRNAPQEEDGGGNMEEEKDEQKQTNKQKNGHKVFPVSLQNVVYSHVLICQTFL